ncbi:MAG: ABC transporter ATP-binding protein [Ktedonobacterales bacterium]
MRESPGAELFTSPGTPPTGTGLLDLRNVDTFYGPSQVLRDLTVQVNEGEIVCLLGANAAGKTTTMKTIFSIVKPRRGSVSFQGERIDTVGTDQVIKRGLALVPEARRVFSRMSVHENLLMGGFARNNQVELAEDLERVYTLFPRLRERDKQLAGTMSGGEQQMLAMGRALMARPKLVCMDEPSMGLSPILVQTVFNTIQEIRKQGVTVFLVEQNAFMALNVADRGYVLQQGQIVLTDTAKNLLDNDLVRRAYLGG